MTKCFINGIGAVSFQNENEASETFLPITQNLNLANQPSYKELIAPNMIRRMAKGVKMGIYASQMALNEAEIEIPDAIITGTGLGCIEDSEKFLKSIIENDEEFLTPTSFIQSTHNTVGAQIALRLQCKGYNFTYVNGSSSFEMALLDAVMQIQNNEEQNILVGGIDEISQHTMDVLKIAGIVASEKYPNAAKYSEGATFLSLSNLQSKNTYAEVVDVDLCNKVLDIKMWIFDFLKKNNLDIHQINAVILGLNSDQNNHEFQQQILSVFTTQTILHYKHLVGQYDTVSAYGLKVAASYIKTQTTSPNFIYKNGDNKTDNVLVINQNLGKDYAIVLLKNAEI